MLEYLKPLLPVILTQWERKIFVLKVQLELNKGEHSWT